MKVEQKLLSILPSLKLLSKTISYCSKAIISRTKDAVIETDVNISTVNEDVVTTGETEGREADPMKVEVAANIKPVVFKESILKEIENIVISTVRYAQMRRREAFKYFLEKRAARWTSRMWSRTKHFANDHFKRLYNKTDVTPIQKAEEKNFAVMKRLLLERVIDAKVDYDEKGNVKSYRLFHPVVQGHISQTIFDTKFKNHRGVDTRSIYFFELERLIEILMDNSSVSRQTMEPILNYHTLRKRDFDERYGNWVMHDDSDYLFPEEEEDQIDEFLDDVIDLTADDEVEQPQQTSKGNPSTTQHQYTPPSNQDQREEVMNLYSVLNRDHSMRPYYIPRVLDKPIRVNEDPKLGEKRRETLYNVHGRKFRVNRNEMEFICCNSGRQLWFTLDGARYLGSHALKLGIEEIEDFFVETPEKAALLADLNLLVDQLKREEQKAKEERKAQK
ncbi:hypothetical protein DCAR_0101042 [Daucus carota subsp. sativus]|uniref:Uncharacterized protein n=1 Tax=Daucus carota subsp. sativus TaxID=79200 RepID=A0A175YB09_DAUCS|nr:hypothetical protein DCAR_0101042 [Daucus carota subsp. sativus]